MCVIISRKPGIVLTPNLIETACHVNADGWGISVLDRGKLETRHDFTPTGNKPEDVIKAFDDAVNCHVWLHLRYTTRGAKNITNCHPFQVAKLGTHGQDIFFMHNGTISGFSEDKEPRRSDSHLFADTLLSGLINQLAHNSNIPILQNPYLSEFLLHFAGTFNVFTLYDNLGNEMIIDPAKNGKFWDGWWSSNEYSFNRTHRGSSYDWEKNWKQVDGKWIRSSTYSTATSSSGQSVVPFRNEKGSASNANEPASISTPKPTETSMGKSDLSGSTLKEQCEIIGQAKEKAKTIAERKKIAHVAPEHRWTFAELSGFNTLEELFLFTEDEIEDLVDEAPEAATLLILDLIYELYRKEKGSPSILTTPAQLAS